MVYPLAIGYFVGAHRTINDRPTQSISSCSC